MGKPNKSAAWFQAVKKAFRSPSKEKSDNKDDTAKKIHTGEKFGSSITASPIALLQEPTPLPLPSFGKIGLDEGEQQQGRSHKKQPINPVVEAMAMDAPVIVDNSSQEKENEQESLPLAAAAAAGDAESITNGSIGKQSVVEMLLNQEEYGSPSADKPVTKIEQAFARGLVRLQALVRGHRVRRQAGTTLRAVEALVRVQARIRGHRVRMSQEGQAIRHKLRQHQQEEHWDASFTQSPEDGAWKHEKIVAHAPFSQQQTVSNPTPRFMDYESNQHHWVWSWLERWTAARPWENHYLDDQKDTSCRTVLSSGKFSDSGTKMEFESGGMTKASKKDGENRQAGAFNPQIKTRKSPVQESLFKSIPFPLPTPPSGTDPLSVPKSMPALVDVVCPPPVINNQVDSQLLEPSTREEGPLPPLKGSADSPPSRVPPSPPALDENMPVPMSPPACMDSLHAPFSPTADTSPSQAQSTLDLPGVSSLKAEEEEEEGEEEEEEANGVAKDEETNGLMCLESCNSLTLKDGHEQHERHNGSNGSKMNVKLTAAGNRKSEMNDKAVGEENGENAVPTSFKTSTTPTTSRYMTATESAKAKFRSLSNPKSRNLDEMEMRAKPLQRRLSQGGGGGTATAAQLAKSNSQSSSNSRNQHTNPFQTHTSPKGRIWVEKSEGETGTESPRRRDSYGGGETKPAIRWR